MLEKNAHSWVRHMDISSVLEETRSHTLEMVQICILSFFCRFCCHCFRHFNFVCHCVCHFLVIVFCYFVICLSFFVIFCHFLSCRFCLSFLLSFFVVFSCHFSFGLSCFCHLVENLSFFCRCRAIF